MHYWKWACNFYYIPNLALLIVSCLIWRAQNQYFDYHVLLDKRWVCLDGIIQNFLRKICEVAFGLWEIFEKKSQKLTIHLFFLKCWCLIWLFFIIGQKNKFYQTWKDKRKMRIVAFFSFLHLIFPIYRKCLCLGLDVGLLFSACCSVFVNIKLLFMDNFSEHIFNKKNVNF